MRIRFDCPRCKRTIDVPIALGGESGNCPHCRAAITIPRPGVDALEPAGGLTAIDPESVRKKLLWPVVGLIGVGLLTATFTCVTFFLNRGARHGDVIADQLALITTNFGIFFSPMIVIAAHQLYQLKGSKYGLFAAILTLLPCSPACFGAPIGIWTLMVLASPEVKEFFRRRSR